MSIRSMLNRLLLPPAAAALAVLILATLTVIDLLTDKKLDGINEDAPKFSSSKELRRVSMKDNFPNLNEVEALGILERAPTKAAIMTLWPLQTHRERLFKLLISNETESELRLYLLGSFKEANANMAVIAARAIAEEKNLPLGPLLLFSFEVLSQAGEEEDLFLLSDREFEPRQFKTLREKYRLTLHDRIHRD